MRGGGIRPGIVQGAEGGLGCTDRCQRVEQIPGQRASKLVTCRLSLFERSIVFSGTCPLQRANITTTVILLGRWLQPLIPERGTTNRFISARNRSADEIIDCNNGAFYC